MQPGEEPRAQLESLKRRLEGAGRPSVQHAECFMSLPDQAKEAYAWLEAGRRYQYGWTITHLLHQCQPSILELGAPWVDALLEAEWDLRDGYGWCGLMYLLRSDELDGFDFGCRRFQALLQRQRDWVDRYNQTVLMVLCRYNPQLLRHRWAIEMVQRQGGRVKSDGLTALIKLFVGNARRTDFSQRGFRLLWDREKIIKT